MNIKMTKSEIRLHAYNLICKEVFMMHYWWYRRTGVFIPDGNFFLEHCLPRGFWSEITKDPSVLTENYVMKMIGQFCMRNTTWTKKQLDAAKKEDDERKIDVDEMLEWGKKRARLEKSIKNAIAKFEAETDFKIYALNYCEEKDSSIKMNFISELK